MSDIIEAARRALYGIDDLCWDQDDERKVNTVIAVATPLIEANALERAAQVAEDYDVKRIDGYIARDNVATAIAAAIRALKEQP